MRAGTIVYAEVIGLERNGLPIGAVDASRTGVRLNEFLDFSHFC